jgi:large subunit ribosomal protein L10
MVYPVDSETSIVSIARELIDIAKDIKHLQFRGAYMEGIVFGPDELDALSKYPTRSEAQAQVVQILLSPAQNLVSAILSPGRKVAALVKAIEEKLDKSEELKTAG